MQILEKIGNINIKLKYKCDGKFLSSYNLTCSHPHTITTFITNLQTTQTYKTSVKINTCKLTMSFSGLAIHVQWMVCENFLRLLRLGSLPMAAWRGNGSVAWRTVQAWMRQCCSTIQACLQVLHLGTPFYPLYFRLQNTIAV